MSHCRVKLNRQKGKSANSFLAVFYCRCWPAHLAGHLHCRLCWRHVRSHQWCVLFFFFCLFSQTFAFEIVHGSLVWHSTAAGSVNPCSQQIPCFNSGSVALGQSFSPGKGGQFHIKDHLVVCLKDCQLQEKPHRDPDFSPARQEHCSPQTVVREIHELFCANIEEGQIRSGREFCSHCFQDNELIFLSSTGNSMSFSTSSTLPARVQLPNQE